MNASSMNAIAIFLFAIVAVSSPHVANASIRYCDFGGQEDSTDGKSTARIEVTVTDRDEQPIANAEVRVQYWSGKWDEGPQGNCDKDGTVRLGGIELDNFVYLQASAPGYGKSQQMLNLDTENTSTLSVKLTKAIEGSWVTVLDPGGEPVSGARFQRLDYTDINGFQSVITWDTAESLGFELTSSDANGRLELPQVPEDSSVTAWVIHPAWMPAKLSKLEPKVGELATIALESGPKVTVNFYSDDLSEEELNQRRAEIQFMPSNRASSATETIRTSFPIADNKIQFTAHPAQYNSISINVEGFIVSPEFSILGKPEPRLNLTTRSDSTFDVLVMRKFKAKGRVTDVDGKPLSNIWLLSSVESKQVSPSADGSFKSTVVEEAFVSGGQAETDEDGFYEIDIVAGKASVQVMSHGYFRDPPSVEFEVGLNDTDGIEAPGTTLYKVPILKGKVRGVDGKPLPGAVVRMTSTGFGDAFPVGVTDQAGNFELEMTRIPYSIDGGLETDAYIVAFDPKGSYSGLSKVDLKDPQAVNDIEVNLKNEDPSWVLNPIKDLQKEAAEKRLEKLGGESFKQEIKSQMAEHAKAFPEGVAGKLVPTMEEGTWLNTDANSLEDFRGKYVLLDFWFIGCGPCPRDMPSVSLTHRVFSEMGFSVVGVHTNMQKPDAVLKFANDNDMNFPIVVDNAEGEIIEAYRDLGLVGFPNYILLDPEGKVLINDAIPDPLNENQHSLRESKIEIIYNVMHGGRLP